MNAKYSLVEQDDVNQLSRAKFVCIFPDNEQTIRPGGGEQVGRTMPFHEGNMPLVVVHAEQGGTVLTALSPDEYF